MLIRLSNYTYFCSIARWPENSLTYHRYIEEKENMRYKVVMVVPTLEIIPDDQSIKPNKRLTLKHLSEEEIVLYLIGDSYIKKIIRIDSCEYVVNGRYSLKTPDHLTDNELICLLFVYNN